MKKCNVFLPNATNQEEFEVVSANVYMPSVFSVCLSAPMWLTPSGSSQKRRRLVLGSQSPGLEISKLLRPTTPPITSKWVIIGLKRRLIIGSF